jgi:hypothetical protein
MDGCNLMKDDWLTVFVAIAALIIVANRKGGYAATGLGVAEVTNSALDITYFINGIF